jgi:hypothetical protein
MFYHRPMTWKKVEASVKKQRLFSTSISSAISYIILDLDLYDAQIAKTLRQALMQMQSKDSPNWNLFLAIDTSWNMAPLSHSFLKRISKEKLML